MLLALWASPSLWCRYEPGGPPSTGGPRGGNTQGTRDRSGVAVPVVPGTDRAPLPGCGRSSLDVVDSNAVRDEVRDFLASRRARITPEQAGLPVYGSNRRVKGLRREELAMLAGVSVDYYTRLERGNLAGASDGVLDALARALQLDDAETQHLFDLARAA